MNDFVPNEDPHTRDDYPWKCRLCYKQKLFWERWGWQNRQHWDTTKHQNQLMWEREERLRVAVYPTGSSASSSSGGIGLPPPFPEVGAVGDAVYRPPLLPPKEPPLALPPWGPPKVTPKPAAPPIPKEAPTKLLAAKTLGVEAPPRPTDPLPGSGWEVQPRPKRFAAELAPLPASGSEAEAHPNSSAAELAPPASSLPQSPPWPGPPPPPPPGPVPTTKLRIPPPPLPPEKGGDL